MRRVACAVAQQLRQRRLVQVEPVVNAGRVDDVRLQAIRERQAARVQRRARRRADGLAVVVLEAAPARVQRVDARRAHVARAHASNVGVAEVVRDDQDKVGRRRGGGGSGGEGGGEGKGARSDEEAALRRRRPGHIADRLQLESTVPLYLLCSTPTASFTTL